MFNWWYPWLGLLFTFSAIVDSIAAAANKRTAARPNSTFPLRLLLSHFTQIDFCSSIEFRDVVHLLWLFIASDWFWFFLCFFFLSTKRLYYTDSIIRLLHMMNHIEQAPNRVTHYERHRWLAHHTLITTAVLCGTYTHSHTTNRHDDVDTKLRQTPIQWIRLGFRYDAMMKKKSVDMRKFNVWNWYIFEDLMNIFGLPENNLW